MTRARILTAIIFLLTFGYVILRHNVFGEVSWNMLSLYTLNKALAWTGLCLLVLTFSIGSLVKKARLGESWLKERKALGKMSFNILGLHAVWTLLLFRTEFGLDFIWQDDAIRAEGVLSLVLGSTGLGLLGWYSRKAAIGPPFGLFFRRAPMILLTIAVLHITTWGFLDWLNPASWPGFLPPVTLLAALIALAGILSRK